MASVISRPSTHNCRAEIAEDLLEAELPVGTIVECSCKRQFVRRDDQRDGLYWADSPQRDV